ncbi:MAG: NAD-dependent deacylase [Peptoniphilus sp.]|nr:NAD-dependent deacylase [Peptoniphilus sp.]MDD7362531.1 NAD-dependent deacylase [Bacillota bacterium]MDY6045070.1 NAD-dependent deacylase [Peptoniphilus sp.]
MDQFEKAADLLKHAKYAVCLTGAGISTESGIPDFRSDRGYYNTFIPEDALSVGVLESDPQRFYKEGYTILKDLEGKKPNPGHRALAEMQKGGYLHEIITQNIDDLHQQAGAKDVLQVHGDASTARCERCDYRCDFDEFDRHVEEGDIPPTCPKCGHEMRTNVVLFGDAMPPAFDRAVRVAEKADVMLVVGSSLQVMPVAYLPRMAEHLIIVNQGATPYDHTADVIFKGTASDVLVELEKRLSE